MKTLLKNLGFYDKSSLPTNIYENPTKKPRIFLELPSSSLLPLSVCVCVFVSFVNGGHRMDTD